MGSQRTLLGRTVVMKAYRKHGNGAIGSGRKQSTGKRGSVYEINSQGERELLAKVEGPTAQAVLKELRAEGFIPTWVSVNNNGETSF